MYRDFMPEMVHARLQDYHDEARKRSLARKISDRPPARARMARRLMDAAFLLDSEESWRAMWDRMTGESKEKSRPGVVEKRYAR